jgi:hypothetical protein
MVAAFANIKTVKKLFLPFSNDCLLVNIAPFKDGQGLF